MTSRRSLLKGLLGAAAAPIAVKVAEAAPPAPPASPPAPALDVSKLSAINADLGDVWPLRIQSPDRLFLLDFRTGEVFMSSDAIVEGAVVEGATDDDET